jgi:hypothetical protein
MPICGSCGWDTRRHAPGCTIRQREISEGGVPAFQIGNEDIPAMDADPDWYDMPTVQLPAAQPKQKAGD